MTSHVARLYALAASLLALFLAWVGVSAAPWQADPPPPTVRIVTAPPVATTRTS